MGAIADRLVVGVAAPAQHRLLTTGDLPTIDISESDRTRDDVRSVLADSRFGVESPAGEPGVDNGTLFQDPPAHTRLRKLVTKAFTVRRVEALRPPTVALAARLLDESARLTVAASFF